VVTHEGVSDVKRADPVRLLPMLPSSEAPVPRILRSTALFAYIAIGLAGCAGNAPLRAPTSDVEGATAPGPDANAEPTGEVGAAGTVGTAGSFGAAGAFGTAGTLGAAGTTPATCIEGAASCADAQTGGLCLGGVFHTFNCPVGCFDGVCAECAPSSTTCDTNTVLVCAPSGIWQPAQTCATACVNGACAESPCAEGATSCATAQSQQTCSGGQWLPATSCEFVCIDGECGSNVRHVFVTSQAFVPGELGGLMGADDICRKLAVSAGLSSSYAAWLSDDTGSPVSRFPLHVGPYVLVDGTVVANNWSDLTSGVLRHPIDLNEMGGPPGSGVGNIARDVVWTDTSPSGALSTLAAGDGSCSDWSDPSGTTVVIGSSDLSSMDWTEGGRESSDPGTTPTICDGTADLYCFEQ
jgi:hypothetical protein